LANPERRAVTLSTTGCGFLFLAALALLAGMIPFLAWTNLVITLPLAIVGTVATATHARKPAAQPTDRVAFSLALVFLAVVLFRLVIM
jgi:hypothetical protein